MDGRLAPAAELDRQAPSIRVAELEIEAMAAGDVARYMQAQAHAVWVPGPRLAAPEGRLDDPTPIGLGNPRTVVDHPERPCARASL